MKKKSLRIDKIKNFKKKYDFVIWVLKSWKNNKYKIVLEDQNKDIKIENKILGIYHNFYINLNKVDDFFKLNNSILNDAEQEKEKIKDWFFVSNKIDESKDTVILGLSKKEFKIFEKNNREKNIIWLWDNIISKSMLIYFHSLFENFLIKTLELIYNNSDKQFNDDNIKFTFLELKEFWTIEDAKKCIINQKISKTLYASIDKQFDVLFDLLWINKYENKKDFPIKDLIEISLRRNLFTHEDGIVNDIYINKCIEYWIENNFEKWKRIIFENEYMVYYEFLIKIVFYLWIKLSEEENKFNKVSSNFINNKIFNMIKEGELELGLKISNFILESKFIKNVNESTKLMLLLNKALIYKMNSNNEEVYKILKSIDWSAQPNLFKLARSVLLEDWEDSGIFMLKVVKKDLKDEDWEEYIWSLQLETWPLFFEFKNTDIFKKNYKKIFKKDFILDV